MASVPVSPGARARQEGIPRQTPRFGIDTGLFFALFYLYVWAIIDPRLIHHSLGIFVDYSGFDFSTGWAFFREHLARPGGLVEYCARFGSQFYRFGWVGALIITAAAWCTCLCMDVLSRVAGLPRGMVLRYSPAVALLMVYSTYSHPLGTVVALLTALSGFALYWRFGPDDTVKRAPILVVTSVALYYVAGAGALLLAVLAAVHELLIRRRMLVAAVAILCGLGVPWLVGKMLAGLPVGTAYGRFVLVDPGVASERWPYALVLYLLFPVVPAAAATWRAVLARRAFRAADRQLPEAEGPKTEKSFRFPRRHGKWAVQMAVVLLAAGAGAWFTSDDGKKITLEMDYHACNGKWAQVLDTAETMPSGQWNLRYSKNLMLALHHTGRLGSEMFRYAQMPRVGLLTSPLAMPKKYTDMGAWFQQSRILLDLGHVNLAEKFAYEALENTGNLPGVLRHLAIIHIVKDQPATARLFLNVLSRNPLHHREAREMLERLQEDPRLEGDPRVRKLRPIAPDRDNVFSVDTRIEDLFLALLARNRHNQMAFEFLMAHYLRARRPDRVVANIWRLDNFAYEGIPRHYQEAVLVYVGVMNKTVDSALRNRIDPEIIKRYETFRNIRRESAGGEDAVGKAIAAGFGDSYFFYYAHGASGL